MQPDELLPFIWEVKKLHPKIHVAVAGGLGPDTMSAVEPILQVFSDVSIDAQGALRSSKDSRHPVDWLFAKQYLVEASNRFIQFEKR